MGGCTRHFGVMILAGALCGSAMAWPSAPPLPGQGMPLGDTTSVVEVGARAFSGNRSSSKFEEYRDYRPGLFGNAFIHDESADRTRAFDVIAVNPGYDDQRISLGYGRYGSWEVQALVDEVPHRFSDTARTIYTPVSPGLLVLSPGTQAFLADGGVTATQSARLAATLAKAGLTSLEFQQTNTSFSGKFTPGEHWALSADYTKMHKNGTRPIGLGFGSPGNNFVNVAAPIDQDIHDVKTSAEYRGKGWNVNLGYWGSFFRNGIDTLTVDNPLVAKDTVAAGARQGRIDLDPDNDAHTFSLAGSKKLDAGWPSRISGTVSIGRRTQDDAFVPQTINTLIQSVALNLPRPSLDGRSDTTLVNLTYSGRPTKDVNVNGRFRYYDLASKTPDLTLFGHVVNDRSLTIETRDTHPTEYTKENASLDGAWRLSRELTWRGGYEHERWDRPDHREVTTTKEDIWKTGLDWRPDREDRWLVRTDFSAGAKVGSDYNPFAHFHNVQEEDDLTLLQLQSPLLRKFDLANRRQEKAQLMAQYTPRQDVTVGVTGIYGLSDYDASPLGLQTDERISLGADGTWQMNERTRWSSFLTLEKIRARQLDRFRTRTAVGAVVTLFDDPLNDFNSSTIDRVNTFGGSFDYAIKPGKWDCTISWVRQLARGQTLASPVPGSVLPAGAPDAGNAVNFPELRDQLDTLSAILRHHLKENLSLQLEYRYEHYQQDNFKLDGLQPFMASSNVNGNGVVSASTDVFLGDQLGNYNVHAFAVSALQRF